MKELFTLMEIIFPYTPFNEAFLFALCIAFQAKNVVYVHQTVEKVNLLLGEEENHKLLKILFELNGICSSLLLMYLCADFLLGPALDRYVRLCWI
jgi:hypothetical protein